MADLTESSAATGAFVKGWFAANKSRLQEPDPDDLQYMGEELLVQYIDFAKDNDSIQYVNFGEALSQFKAEVEEIAPDVISGVLS